MSDRERVEKLFILYDGRAKTQGTDDATVLVTEETERRAQRTSRNYKGYDAIWYEYDVAEDGVTIDEVGARPDIGKGLLR